MSDDWTIEQWAELESRVQGTKDVFVQKAVFRAARKVLREFSSSFFLVTRFLPARKRANVELVYAAVRYPDEIVDTFDLPGAQKHAMLDNWERCYEDALQMPDIRERLRAGQPWILAAFAEVVRGSGIPREHYRSFLAAMRRDIAPEPFLDFDDLISNYVYGSAVVVGYFLAHVYGTADGAGMEEAYEAAGNLGIALQLTNFCRDVAEDRARGRQYIPSDLLQSLLLEEAVAYLAEDAEARYGRALESLSVFAADTRPAIHACIEVYRRLNRRILDSGGDTRYRHSVPIAEKFRALPPGKYWRVPLAYLGGL